MPKAELDVPNRDVTFRVESVEARLAGDGVWTRAFHGHATVNARFGMARTLQDPPLG